MSSPRCGVTVTCSRRSFVAAITVLFAAPAPATLAGQSPETRIVVLGSNGGPLLREDRSEPATLLIVDGRRYLIDCGIGTERRLLEAGIASESIGTIFLTHLHPDHDLGLADVLANDFQQRDQSAPGHTINIYGPPQTRALVDAAYQYIRIPYAILTAEGGGQRGGVPATTPFATHEISDGVVYQDDRIRVVAAENTHYALMPQGSRATMKSYSYRIETPHGVVVFTGDTGPSDAVVRLAQDADVLVSEVSDFVAVLAFVDTMAARNHWPPARRTTFKAHMTQEHLDIKDVGQMAARAHVKSVLLNHWSPADPAVHVRGVSRYFSGPVFGSADLQQYCLGDSAAGHGAPLHPCH